MDEYDPSIPPRAPSIEAGLQWRKLCAQAVAAAELATVAGKEPSVLVTSYGSRAFTKAWSIIKFHDVADGKETFLVEHGVFVHQTGKLALYNAHLQKDPQPEYRKKLMYVNHMFNYSDLMDKAPSTSAIVMSPDKYPHSQFDLLAFTVKNENDITLPGLVAVEYALGNFLRGFGATPLD